jgi:hypothetical protein
MTLTGETEWEIRRELIGALLLSTQCHLNVYLTIWGDFAYTEQVMNNLLLRK